MCQLDGFVWTAPDATETFSAELTDSCVGATSLILFSQKQLEHLPPPYQRAVAPLPVLQAAVHEVPQPRRQERQGHARGAHRLL